MSLGKNWEGKASDEAEPEELPDLDARDICDRRNGANRKELLRLSAFLRTGVLFLRQKEAQLAFNFSGTRNSASSAGKIKK